MPAGVAIVCAYCQTEVPSLRVTKKFCSSVCAQRHARGWPKKRHCRECGAEFEVRERADANRQHCSQRCAKRHNSKAISTWHAEHPEQMKLYYARRVERDPGVWRRKSRTERERIIELLGGRCVVCDVANPHWLHADYIATTRGSKYRHPRHYAYVSRHTDEFRLLCANHHYELTLTGAIAGTDITQ